MNRGSEFCRLMPYHLAMTPIKKELNKYQAQNGADDEARTRYLNLGKVALYRMSYIRILRMPSGGIEPPTRGFSVPCSTD